MLDMQEVNWFESSIAHRLSGDGRGDRRRTGDAGLHRRHERRSGCF